MGAPHQGCSRVAGVRASPLSLSSKEYISFFDNIGSLTSTTDKERGGFHDGVRALLRYAWRAINSRTWASNPPNAPNLAAGCHSCP